MVADLNPPPPSAPDSGDRASLPPVLNSASSHSAGSGEVETRENLISLAQLGNGHFFEVRLDLFDGPIDLLLHLVKKNELSIERLSLASITSQYLACLELMREFDLEIAGEYLVIAATLLSIKSSVLLNEPVQLEIDGDGNLVNPHEELLRKLRDAEVFKEGASLLAERKLLGVDVFAPPESCGGVEAPPVQFVDHSPILLGKAFRRLIERLPQEGPGFTISMDSVSIVERMMFVLDALKARGGSVNFTELVPQRGSRGEIISHFVALLELCKRGAIHVQQEQVFDDIVITLGAADPERIQITSEFDDPIEELRAQAREKRRALG